MRLKEVNMCPINVNYVKTVDDLSCDMINFVEYSFNDDIFYMRLSGANQTLYLFIFDFAKCCIIRWKGNLN